ncbi:MAG: DUF1488 domain-containing protein [Ectothiorhodospiraceae bacterium]|nr:DUF1488 domain-containing protein [Chromatiales bacterium]MCP5156392.1 DUF1488 domain-containing protein [Ectothiorhodospiraceae bacterium]
MHVNRRRSPNSNETEIEFPFLQCWNPMTRVASIAAQVNKRRVTCRVAMKILEKRFPTKGLDPMQHVVDNRRAIEDAARRLIERKAFEEDGSILIRERDI